MEDGNVRFSLKKKGQYSRTAFYVKLAKLFILSTPWKMFPFKNTRDLFCFNSNVDENTATIHFIERFV